MCIFFCAWMYVCTPCAYSAWGSQKRALDLLKQFQAVVSHRCVCWSGRGGQLPDLTPAVHGSYTLLLCAGRMVCHVLDVSYDCVYYGQCTYILLYHSA